MKKERKTLLALLLIFVCGLAFLVLALVDENNRSAVVIHSNGEEIVPYQNKIALSVWQDHQVKYYIPECDWLDDEEIKSQIPEITYADDFLIKGKNNEEFSYGMSIYRLDGKFLGKATDLSKLPTLQAGIYYIGLVRYDHDGEYVEELNSPQNESMICEYLFKMRKPSKAAEGEPLVTVYSNGEEISPFMEGLSYSRWAPIGTWVEAMMVQRWPKDKSVVSEFPVITYADDFEIRYRDDAACSETLNIYNSIDDTVSQVGDKSYLSQLPAGTYYVLFYISYQSGEWMETEHHSDYERSGSYQCLLTLIKR